MQDKDIRLRQIADFLLLNAGFTDNSGLLNGKMGIAIFFYHYYRYTGNNIYNDFAGELIDQVYEEINTSTPVNFEDGLTGIGWGIEYLVKNRFVDADTDEALSDIDNAVYKNLTNYPLVFDSNNEFFGYGLYFISRLKNNFSGNDLKTLIKKQHLVFLIDECERILIYNRYLEFNIGKISIKTINSIIWFLLQVNSFGLLNLKIIKLIEYLLDYYSFNRVEDISYHDQYVLCKLARLLDENFPGGQVRTRILKITNSFSTQSHNYCRCNLNEVQTINLLSVILGFNQFDVYSSEFLNNTAVIHDVEVYLASFIEKQDNLSLSLNGLAGLGLLLTPSGVLPSVSRAFLPTNFTKK